MSLPTIPELIARADLEELVARYANVSKRTARCTTYHCPNPLHEDKNPSFTVSVSRSGKQVARCHSQCAWSGDALDFLKWIENASTVEALTLLRNSLGLPAETKKPPMRSAPKPIERASSRVTGTEAREFLAKYCRARGWPLEVADRFGLEVVLDLKKEPRIRHPYLVRHKASGAWVPGYWQDRARRDVKPKWLSPRDSTPLLFNLPSLEVPNLEAVVICEGAPDAITATLALEGCRLVAVVGVPGVNAWQPRWAELFTGLRVLVAADRDRAGEALEQAIFASLDSPPAIFRPSSNDLTDTAHKIGLGRLRERLLGALGTQPEATERPLPETLELLHSHFPGGFLVEGAEQ